MAYEVNIDNFDRNDWERYANNFADYNIYQTWPYQQVRAEMDGQEVSRVVVKDENGHVVTMCQIRIKHIIPLGLKIGYVQRGPLFRYKNGNVTCTVEALRQLCEIYVGNKVNVLRIVPNVCNNEAGEEISEMLISSGFQYIHLLTPYRTFILRVDDSEEGIRKRLRKSFRRDLRYAEKVEIEIRKGHNGGFCKILEELYLASLQRKGFRGLNPEEFIRPQLILSPSEKMSIIVAYCNGDPVSVHLESNLGDTAVVLLSATNKQGLSCGSSYLVWYQGAISALHAGMKLYDLGGIDPDNNPNVYQFKSRMGGKEAFHIGTFEAYSGLMAKNIWRAAEKVYRLIKK
jgi:lipid II:glycine glycyltransferase (peptidoglycan interpeptide bridge formation enzyme)